MSAHDVSSLPPYKAGEHECEYRELAYDLWTMVVLPRIAEFDTLTDPFGVFRRAEVLLDEPIEGPPDRNVERG